MPPFRLNTYTSFLPHIVPPHATSYGRLLPYLPLCQERA
ncbi:multidrug efflux RND transporter permease subunit [Acetobacter orientalis]|uniref:Multidrug efflux RND transporter permease subunit n=1 Tax=Acetobacter orientalis TaxID=146474 RepID=A0A2Z5ZKQ1_9PROT|nr:multidrug efflux RND transporter permease subunit [Acetobacter orientalis]